MQIITARQTDNLTKAETFEDYSDEHYIGVSKSARSGHGIGFKPSCPHHFEWFYILFS